MEQAAAKTSKLANGLTQTWPKFDSEGFQGHFGVGWSFFFAAFSLEK